MKSDMKLLHSEKPAVAYESNTSTVILMMFYPTFSTGNIASNGKKLRNTYDNATEQTRTIMTCY